MRAKVMRVSISVILAGLLAATSALGQVQTGNEVSVNPLPAAGNVLLYPGGQYTRVVQPLRQPGQTAKDSGEIQLHMPGTRRATRSASAPATATRSSSAPAPRRAALAANPAPAKHVAAAPPTATPASGYNPGYGALGAPPMDQSIIAPSQPAPRQQVAKASPPPASAVSVPLEPGLTKRSMIIFAAGAADPAQGALGSIKFLAGDLNTAMVSSSSRIQLLAYGGNAGDKGSDARRLSLKRALAIRQVLIDSGVPAERIDVRAMGGADDGGPADRVDVFVKT
jgi:outer membrane protein OmpA-like peptidoglycan-associated protein